MKNCLNCKHGCITELLKGFAETKKVNVNTLVKRYCLIDRNYHNVRESCKYFFPQKFKLTIQ